MSHGVVSGKSLLGQRAQTASAKALGQGRAWHFKDASNRKAESKMGDWVRKCGVDGEILRAS